MRNIILIGMPGCGKSSVGEVLCQRLGLPLLDTDAMVEKMEGRTIAALFSAEGEAYFRALESAAAARAAEFDGAVISTGGGMILRRENMDALKKRGAVIFLDRPPEVLAGLNHKDRPLLAEDSRRVFALYDQRIDLYRQYADHTIENVGTAEEAADAIMAFMERTD